MRQPNPFAPSTRKPGRSFDDPSRPLGEEIVEEATEDDNAPLEEGIYGRAKTAHPPSGHGAGVAERAKAVAVLRKAEEFLYTSNPPPTDMRRALELAAGRIALTIEEYDRIVESDEELQALERKVLEDAAQRAPRHY
jgi:hypothetical protein